MFKQATKQTCIIKKGKQYITVITKQEIAQQNKIKCYHQHHE